MGKKGKSLSDKLDKERQSLTYKQRTRVEEQRSKMRGELDRRFLSQAKLWSESLQQKLRDNPDLRPKLEKLLKQQLAESPQPTAESALDQLKGSIHLVGERDEPLPYCDCAICLDDMLPDQKVIQFPCNAGTVEGEPPHVFHSDCLLDWLKEGSKCPLCIFRHEDVDNLDDQLQAHLDDPLTLLPPLPPLVKSWLRRVLQPPPEHRPQ